MTLQTNAPMVFISYSWKPATNKEKVTQLAERLSRDGIHVVIDIWDLSEGQDKYQFMEQMVNSSEIKKVLLICNKDYALKANDRVGGVGTESLIVSKEIYSKADQTKFIPIIFEFDEKGEPYVPTFAVSRIYIDLSNDDVFEENYDKLIRNLHDKPASKRPPIGSPPTYIEDDAPVFLPTAYKVSAIKKALIDEKKNTILLIQDYYDSFINSFRHFEIALEELTTDNFQEVILKKINELSALRDDFVDFLNTYTTYSIDMDVDRLHGFFERQLEYFLTLAGMDLPSRTLGSIRIDHFRFFFYELFLHFTCIMVEKGRYKELGHILNTPFIVQSGRDIPIEHYFVSFHLYVSSLNDKYGDTQAIRVGDKIRERATGIVKQSKIQEADLLLYYVSTFREKRIWTPETLLHYFHTLPMMNRAASKRFFDKIKPIFDVGTKEELIAKVQEAEGRNKPEYDRFHFGVPLPRNGLSLDILCTMQ